MSLQQTFRCLVLCMTLVVSITAQGCSNYQIVLQVVQQPSQKLSSSERETYRDCISQILRSHECRTRNGDGSRDCCLIQNDVLNRIRASKSLSRMITNTETSGLQSNGQFEEFGQLEPVPGPQPYGPVPPPRRVVVVPPAPRPGPIVYSGPQNYGPTNQGYYPKSNVNYHRAPNYKPQPPYLYYPPPVPVVPTYKRLDRMIQCPTQANQSQEFQLSGNDDDYPIDDIVDELNVRSTNADPLNQCVMRMLLPLNTEVTTLNNPTFDNATTNCRSSNMRVLRYNYQGLERGRCFLLRGVGQNEDIRMKSCLSNYCRFCSGNDAYYTNNHRNRHYNDHDNDHYDDYYDDHHPHHGYQEGNERYEEHSDYYGGYDGHRGYPRRRSYNISRNVCASTFKSFYVLAYCENRPVNDRIIQDRIVVPVDCCCRKIPCPVRYTEIDVPQKPYPRHHPHYRWSQNGNQGNNNAQTVAFQGEGDRQVNDDGTQQGQNQGEYNLVGQTEGQNQQTQRSDGDLTSSMSGTDFTDFTADDVFRSVEGSDGGVTNGDNIGLNLINQ